ncbi:PepSY domain-containing protein [Methylocystis echinoides]|uniref:Peptidase n=1 Tax=Methylocystis echinoides TaxID=29468 RepID=A0A9W6GSL6_9HYPH|nr:PepSY domain-containing protein [Methylocystis echinoides]GLI92327.1 peptidase [Methylocystis echinoides]
MPVLLFVHRWIGVALAIFMVGWLSSGLVIANSDSIALSRAAQLAHQPLLDLQPGWLSAETAIATSSARLPESFTRGAIIAEARLARIGDTPAWIVENTRGEKHAVSAIDGAPIDISPRIAEQIVQSWLSTEKSVAGIAWLDTAESVIGVRSAEALKPFHRLSALDGEGTIFVVSAKTGDVVQAATRLERGLYYAGAWLHLFRPLDLLNAGDFRRTALSWAGGFAFIGALTGIVVGLVKWRPGLFGRPTYSRGRTQPYREKWLTYHFWAGLIGGVFVAGWAGSGFLSTNPGQIFSPAAASPAELARYYGSAQQRDGGPLPQVTEKAVELRWSRLGDASVLYAYDRDGLRQPLGGGSASIDDAGLAAAATRLAGATALAGRERLENYDSYYVAGHGQSATERPLPVLRVDLADAGHTSLYVDPADGRLLLKLDDSRRTFRWLYSAIHHWDFGWFRNHHAARRGWIVSWALLGLVLAVSAATLAWRRLKRSVPSLALPSQKARSSVARAQ